MKKDFLIFITMFAAIIYILWSISTETLYLSRMSMEAKNPISVSFTHIIIDTHLTTGKSIDDFYISLLPVYFLILLAIIILFLKRK